MISIILQIVAVIVDAYIAFSNDKKKILIATFVYNTFSLILFLLLKDFSTVYSYSLIVSRSVIYLYQTKLKKLKFSFIIPIGIMSLHLILGIRTATSLWHILPTLAPIVVCYLLWFEKSRQNMRIEQAISDSFWLIYNMHVGLYVLCISRVMSIICGIMAYVKNTQQNDGVTSSDVGTPPIYE